MAKQKARSLRFPPDLNATAWIEFERVLPHGTSTLVSIVYNESSTGCNLVCISEEPFVENEAVTVQVGKLQPLRAKLVWSKEIDTSIYRIGLQFLS